MGLFDTSSRSAVRDQGDIYLDKASRFADEARASFQQGRYAEAEERIRQLISLQSRVVGERHPDYASGLCMLAELLVAQDELNDAELLVQRAQEIRKKAIGEDHPDYAAGLDLLVRLMLRYDDAAAAEPLARQAVHIRKTCLGPHHPDYCASLSNLAEIHRSSEQYEDAEAAFREVIALREQLLGEDHPETADALLGLADVAMKRGVPDEAETALRRAIEIRRTRFGETHPTYLDTLVSLATLHQLKGEFDEAESSLRLLLDSRRQALGEKHPDCAAVLTLLANLRQRRGDLRGAENYHRQALDARKHSLGERHPDYAVSLTQLGQILQRVGDHQAAEPLLRQALAIRKDVFGSRHPDYATSLMNLATLVQKRGDTAWAKMLLREAVDVRKAIFGEEHPEYAHCLAVFAELMLHQGEPLAKVETLLRQALAIRGKTLGERHPAYASNLSSLAALMRRQGDLSAAEELLRLALEIREATLGVRHPDYVTNLGNLAWVLQQQGDCYGAEALLTEALELRRQVLGESHPDYRQTQERLEALRAQIAALDPGPTTADVAEDVRSQDDDNVDASSTRAGDPSLASAQEIEETPAWDAISDGDYDEDNDLGVNGDDSDYEEQNEDGASAEAVEIDPYGEAMADIYDEAEEDDEPFDGTYEDDEEAIDGIIDGGPDEAAASEAGFVGHGVFPIGPPPSIDPLDLRSVEADELLLPEWRASSWLVPIDPIPASAEAGVDPAESPAWSEDAPVEDSQNTSSDELADSDCGEPHASWSHDAPDASDPDELFEPAAPLLLAESADNLEESDAAPPTMEEAQGDADTVEADRPEPGDTLDDRIPDEERPHVAALVPDDLPRAMKASGATPARSTIMSETSSQLSQHVAALSDRFSELGERLLTAARQLHAPGTPPAEDLLDAVTECRREFEGLRDRTRGLAESLRLTPPGAEHLGSLHDLTNLLDQVAETEIRLSKSEDLRQRAMSVVDRVLSLAHASQPDFAPLHDCHEKARAFQSRVAEADWAELPPEIEKLAEGDHPFSHLLTLIEERDELSDELWASLHESVGQEFGKSLAAAAARSKLVVPATHTG